MNANWLQEWVIHLWMVCHHYPAKVCMCASASFKHSYRIQRCVSYQFVSHAMNISSSSNSRTSIYSSMSSIRILSLCIYYLGWKLCNKILWSNSLRWNVGGLMKFSGILSAKVLMILMILLSCISWIRVRIRCTWIWHSKRHVLEFRIAPRSLLTLYRIVDESINNRQFKYWFWPLVKNAFCIDQYQRKRWLIEPTGIIWATFAKQQKKWNNSRLLRIYLNLFRPILLVRCRKKTNTASFLIQSRIVFFFALFANKSFSFSSTPWKYVLRSIFPLFCVPFRFAATCVHIFKI